MTRWTLALLGTLAAPTLPGGAEAQPRTCADHAVISTRLAEGWGESRQSIGLGADGAVVETYASLETGTWTIVVTTPGGPTCLVASGDAFEAVAEALDLSEGA